MGNKQSYNLNDGNTFSQGGNAEIAYTYDTAEGINMKKSVERPPDPEASLKPATDIEGNVREEAKLHILRRIPPMPDMPLKSAEFTVD
uniref:Uncharacterized protein n=1 Tax=Panagrolaimus sp. JU765 TaxID=591449 RepID=A0AC34QR87_9BILA